MANFDQLKQSVAALIRTNGAEEITGQIMQDVLLTIINSISGGYMFGGVAQHSGNVGNPDYNVFYLAGSGAYTGYGDAINIPNGCYGVFRYNGSWTQDVVDIGVHLTGTIREGETNGVTGDVINTALQQLFNNIMNILDSLTFTYNTPSAQQATKAMLDVIVTPTGGASHVLTTLTLVSATAAAAGLMSADDKKKVDRMLTDFRSLSFSDTTAVADQATKIVQTLSATLGENPEAITTMTFLAATASKAGLLSAADKAKLDAILGNLRSLEIDDTTAYADLGTKIVESIKATIGGQEETISTFQILAATAEKAGLLSAADKQKLDAILGNLRSLEIEDTTAYADLGDKIVESIKATIGGQEETISTFQILAATASKAGLLSAADKAKLDALWSSGYQFAGIATPSTTPISTTSKIFYIATEAGTYFNAVTVTQGINILSWNGSAWSAVQVIGIDDEPTPASGNLVESGGVFGIKYNSSELELLTNFVEKKGGYLRITTQHPEGEYVSSRYYRLWIFPVTAGNNYTFSSYASANASVNFLFWLSAYDISGETPSFTIVSQEPYKGGASPVQYTDQPVKAPTGASYAAINVYYSRATRDYVLTNLKLMKDLKPSNVLDLAEENKAIISETISLEPSSVVTGKYLGTDGEYEEASYYNARVYSVTGGGKYLLNAYALARNSGIYVLYWLDENQDILQYQYTSTSEEDLILKKEIVKAPANAAYAVVNVRTSLAAEYDFLETGEYLDVESLNTEIRNKADIASLSEKVEEELSETISGYFFKKNGECSTLSSMSILKFPVEGNKKYSFTGKYPKGITTNFIAWLDSDGEIVDGSLTGFIYAEPYKGSMSEAVSYYQQEVTSPAGAAYAVMNTRSGYSYHFYKTGDVINISELKTQIDNADLGLMEVTIAGNPSSIGGSIYIRTSYDDTNDIVTVYHRHANNNITPLETYMGSKSLATSAIMVSANRFHSWGDSTSPLRNGSEAPWHMFAQHGYDIPTVVCEHSLTDSDLNTIWTDNKGRDFKIGKISGSTLYLLPVVSETGITGVYTRSWKNQSVEDPITTLTKDGTTLTITSQSNTQIRPIQSSKEFKILADGVEISNEGIYRCNDLIISETLECFNPFTVETWYPTPVCNTVAMELVQSFNIHGLSHRYDAIINMKEPLIFGAYGTSQGQCLVSDSFSSVGSIATGYDAYVMVPKVKKTVNGNRADMPHITSSSSDDIDAYRNTTSLYDADDLPDREITYLYDGENYLAGFATGVSLTKGLSVKAKRNLYVPTDTLALSISYSNRNKFYLNILRNEAFENSVLPAGFTASFSSYWSYFNPNVNKGQVYWYKDGKDYIIYAHYQDANSNLPITIPSEMDGLTFEVIEKTDGVTILTDNIVNGKIYVTTDNSDHNYVVLRTK